MHGRGKPQLPSGCPVVQQAGQPHPQPAGPGHACALERGLLGAPQRGGCRGVGVGVHRMRHHESPVQLRAGPVVRPQLDAREPPVPAHRLGQPAQHVVDGDVAAGPLGDVGEQLVGGTAGAQQRRAHGTGGALPQRPREQRRDHGGDHRGPDERGLGHIRQPPEHEHERAEPEHHRTRDGGDTRAGHEQAAAPPPQPRHPPGDGAEHQRGRGDGADDRQRRTARAEPDGGGSDREDGDRDQQARQQQRTAGTAAGPVSHGRRPR